MVADPLPAAVASPAPSTDPTRASLLDHDTEALGIKAPCRSRTSAENATLASKAVSSAVAGVTVTVAGRGGAGSGSVLPSPHERADSATAHRPAAANRDLWFFSMIIQL